MPARKLLLPLAICIALTLVAGVPSAAARMKLQRVDGGPQWYGQFSNPLRLGGIGRQGQVLAPLRR